jgi:hypothetical protein
MTTSFEFDLGDRKITLTGKEARLIKDELDALFGPYELRPTYIPSPYFVHTDPYRVGKVFC